MHSTYLRKHFPDLIENYSNDFLDNAKSVIIKNLSHEIWGAGLIVAPKRVNREFVEEYISGFNATITDTLERIITSLVNSESTRTAICLGLPNKFSDLYEPNRMWFWLDASDSKVLENFEILTPIDSNYKITNLRVVYDIEKDAIISTKEYYQLRNKKDTYKNYTYAGYVSNDVSLVNTQECIHDYKSASIANDVSGIVSKLDENNYKFMSYKRSDNENTGIYIGLKNRN